LALEAALVLTFSEEAEAFEEAVEPLGRIDPDLWK